MKYTRYDMKRKRKNNKLMIFISICVIAALLALGTAFYKAADKSDNVFKLQQPRDKQSGNKYVSKKVRYIAVQGGMYQNQQYIDEEIVKLSVFGTPFEIKEEKGTRVFLGIYSAEEVDKIIAQLNDKKVENSKMNFEIAVSDLGDAEIIEIINAVLQVLNRLADENIKSIKTSELKNWCNSLKETEKSGSNINTLQEIKKYITNLPSDISRDKAKESYVYVYNTLIKLAQR